MTPSIRTVAAEVPSRSSPVELESLLQPKVLTYSFCVYVKALHHCDAPLTHRWDEGDIDGRGV
jgi:hypothetical protein